MRILPILLLLLATSAEAREGTADIDTTDLETAIQELQEWRLQHEQLHEAPVEPPIAPVEPPVERSEFHPAILAARDSLVDGGWVELDLRTIEGAVPCAAVWPDDAEMQQMGWSGSLQAIDTQWCSAGVDYERKKYWKVCGGHQQGNVDIVFEMDLTTLQCRRATPGLPFPAQGYWPGGPISRKNVPADLWPHTRIRVTHPSGGKRSVWPIEDLGDRLRVQNTWDPTDQWEVALPGGVSARQWVRDDAQSPCTYTYRQDPTQGGNYRAFEGIGAGHTYSGLLWVPKHKRLWVAHGNHQCAGLPQIRSWGIALVDPETGEFERSNPLEGIEELEFPTSFMLKLTLVAPDLVYARGEHYAHLFRILDDGSVRLERTDGQTSQGGAWQHVSMTTAGMWTLAAPYDPWAQLYQWNSTEIVRQRRLTPANGDWPSERWPDLERSPSGLGLTAWGDRFLMTAGTGDTYLLDPETMAWERYRHDGISLDLLWSHLFQKWMGFPEDGLAILAPKSNHQLWVYVLPDRTPDEVSPSTLEPAFCILDEGSERLCGDKGETVTSAARSGETVLVKRSTQACLTVLQDDVAIRGLPDVVVERLEICDQNWASQKGVVTSAEGVDRLTVENLGINCGAKLGYGSTDGIRSQGADLTVRGVTIEDCGNGILTPTEGAGTTLVEGSTFRRIGGNWGAVPGRHHGVYIHGDRMTVRDSVFEAVTGSGHGIKCRALVCEITGTTVHLAQGSRAVDVPQGGHMIVRDSVLDCSDTDSNDDCVGFGLEVPLGYPDNGLAGGHRIDMSGNTCLLAGDGRARFAVVWSSQTPLAVRVVDCAPNKANWN